MKRILTASLLFIFSAAIFSQCIKITTPELENPYDSESEAYIPFPDLTTTQVSAIQATSAQSGGVFTNRFGKPITRRGVCWSISENPTIDNSCSFDGTGQTGFVSEITNLTPSTTYYVRAFGTNVDGTVYGNQQIFTTLSE